MSDGTILLGVIVAVIGFAGAVTAAVVAARQKGLTELTERLQVEIASLRDKAEDNERRIARLESRDRAWANYVHRLRAHIVAQLPPPPPEWPKDLDV